MKLDLSDEQDRQLVTMLASLKLRLPNLKGMAVSNFKGFNDLAYFFIHCVPCKLEYLSINFSTPSGLDEINTFTIRALVKGIQKVTQQVFIENAIINEDHLEEVVKASSQTVQLIINDSKVLLGRSLDFNRDIVYKTSYISFSNCGGHIKSSKQWDKKPGKFEKLIMAIRDSGLGNSLKSINVKGCKLGKDKVEEQLQDHNISHIDVVEEINVAMEYLQE